MNNETGFIYCRNYGIKSIKLNFLQENENLEKWTKHLNNYAEFKSQNPTSYIVHPKTEPV